MSLWVRVCRLGMALIAVAAAVAVASPTSAATDRTDSWDRYRVLAEHNIFVRDRRRPEPKPERPPPPKPAAAPNNDQRIVLTGIAKRGSEYVAFLENTGTGETIRVQVGGAVGKGKLTAITLNGVDYECGGKVTRIEVGYSLSGSTSLHGKAESGPEDTSEPSRVAPPGDAQDAGTTDILERMRQRRKEELER